MPCGSVIEQSVTVSGIVYVFLGFVVHDWSCAVEFINCGGGPPGIDNYRAFNYLSDFAENWLKGLYMYQDDTRAIISQSDHSFNIYDQKSKCSIYVYCWMRLNRSHMKILAASDTIHATLGCCHSTCAGENSACLTGLQKEVNI